MLLNGKQPSQDWEFSVENCPNGSLAKVAKFHTEPLSVYTANRVFIVMVALCVKRYSKKKIGFWDLNALRSRFKVPASATPSEIDRESVQKRHWVSEWVVMWSQESRNPSSSGNCCFSDGEEFSPTKNKQTEVGEAMWSSNKQSKNIKLWDIAKVTAFITNLSLRGQLHWAWPKK